MRGAEFFTTCKYTSGGAWLQLTYVLIQDWLVHVVKNKDVSDWLLSEGGYCKTIHCKLNAFITSPLSLAPTHLYVHVHVDKNIVIP